MYIKEKITINDKELILESGNIAKNTSSSILAEIDGTTLLATVVCQESNDKDFFPLKVDYFERFYASGKIPCNYFKREGRPSEREILIARLIDRTIRPLFPKNFYNEVQITITVMSINPDINPDIIAIIATSAALSMSNLPFEGPIAALRLSYKNNTFTINPSSNEVKNTDLNLIIAGTESKILMIEAHSNEISENILSKAIDLTTDTFKHIIDKLNKFKTNTKTIIPQVITKDNIYESILSTYKDSLIKAYENKDKTERKDILNNIYTNIFADYIDNNIETKNKKSIQFHIHEIEKLICRNMILKTHVRMDKRKLTDIRKISLTTNWLKKVHGSSIFTRGETQALVSITLGTQKDAQLVDCVFHSNQKHNFILHYNFPPYAVNEIGNSNIVKRREVGHGHLAKKALQPIIPDENEFPYVIRIVSEITESNGSSSMATVCGGSLALMDAGVPIKTHVAGIAMGLIKEQNNYVILSDISGEEDYTGDMDLKLTATKKGITAVQMDTKTQGIEKNIIDATLIQGKKGILYILDLMKNKINKPSKDLSEHVPKMRKININKNKIKELIGKGGVTIKALTEKYNCKINVSNDGCVTISSITITNIDNVISEIKTIIKDAVIGDKYKGKVIKLTQFGAFINILPKKDGLLHISKINKHKINNPNWEITEDLILDVIISKIDNKGKISLNII